MKKYNPTHLCLPALATLLTLSACGSTDESSDAASSDEPLVVYVGRDEELVSPLIDQFTDETGIEVEARYADTPQLAATLIEEGDATPADVFLSQDAGALGALSGEGLLTDLDDSITSRVNTDFTSTDDTWVGVTGRARVIAYDGEELDEADVPASVVDLVEPTWDGAVGFPAGNASFQAFVTGFRVDRGDDAAQQWLDGMVDNDYQAYESNGDVLEAINTGQLDLGLINHYYWFRTAAEVGADQMRAQLKFPEAGDPGALVNVTGAGILSENPDAATFVKYLVSDEGQQYFVDNTFEYPLVDGVEAPEGLPALTDLRGPDIDLSDLADLETTITMIEAAGLT